MFCGQSFVITDCLRSWTHGHPQNPCIFSGDCSHFQLLFVFSPSFVWFFPSGQRAADWLTWSTAQVCQHWHKLTEVEAETWLSYPLVYFKLNAEAQTQNNRKFVLLVVCLSLASKSVFPIIPIKSSVAMRRNPWLLSLSSVGPEDNDLMMPNICGLSRVAHKLAGDTTKDRNRTQFFSQVTVLV